MNSKKPLQVAVVGGSDPEPEVVALATEVGRVIASLGAVVICGGLGGVMEAVARGAKLEGGLTIGILPSYALDSRNPFIGVAVATGLGHARNIIVAASGNVVVALPGSHGTRSEVSMALQLGRPVFGMRAWGEIEGVELIDSLEELKQKLLPIL